MSRASLTREGLAPRFGEHNGAIIVGEYRYLLWRTWDVSRPRLLWVLLNPSTADGRTDDPTLRRSISFSRDWQYGGLEIVNLFALRSRHPRDLFMAADPVGNKNDQYLVAAVTRDVDIVLAVDALEERQQLGLFGWSSA